MLVELGRDGENVLLVVVVPSALVVRDGELGRERRGTGQGGALPGDVLGPGAQVDGQASVGVYVRPGHDFPEGMP